jgi:hypothetical protein
MAEHSPETRCPENDLLALLPWKSARDDVGAIAGVAQDCNRSGLCSDEAGNTRAVLIHTRLIRPDTSNAAGRVGIDERVQRLARRARQHPDGGVVEIDVIFGGGE